MNIAKDFDPKTLRKYAQTLLQLAEAIDDGKVCAVPPGRRDVAHMFLGQPVGDKVVADEYEIPSNEMLKMTTCTHELNAHAFYLVYAYCRITGEFFFSPEHSQVVCDAMRHLK